MCSCELRGAEEKVSCVKNAVKMIAIDVKFAKLQQRPGTFHTLLLSFFSFNARIFLLTWKAVKRNVLKLAVVELFLAID